MPQRLQRVFVKIKSSLFENKNARQTVAKNFFWLSFGQLGSRLIRAVIIVYAARVLGAADYGVFSYLMGIAGFFTIFTDIGIGSVMTRETAKKPQEKSYYFATGFWIKAALSLVVVLIIIFGTPYLTKIEAAKALLPIIAILVVFDGMRDFILSFFVASEKMEWQAIITFLTNILVTVLGFIALYLSPSAKNLTIMYTLAVVIGAIVAIAILWKEFLKIFSHFKKSLIKPIMESALPIAFLGAIGAFMLNTDFVMLGWWQNAEAIGYYSAGQKIVQILYILPALFATAIFPQISRLIGQDNREKIRYLMEKSLGMMFMFALPATIGGIILAKPIINLLYGASYSASILNFQVLMITLLIVFPQTLIGNWGIAYNQQKQIAKYLFAASIINAIFDFILIPRIGFIGSSIATIIALTINSFLIWRFVKKLNDFHVFNSLNKIITASLVMGAIVFIFNVFRINIYLNIILSSGIYFFILYASKEQLLEELRSLIKTLRTA